MAKYLRKRILGAVPIFFGITLFVFLMMYLAPATVADVAGGSLEASSASEKEALEARLGLDRPFPVQYGTWLLGLFQGDLGNSYWSGRPVMDSIAPRVVPTVLLTGTGVLLAILLAIPLGVLAAWKPGSGWDRLSSVLSMLSFGVPGFCLCLLGIYLFSVVLGILPAMGMGAGFWGTARHLILPASVICLGSMGNLLRQTKGSMLEVLGEDYIVAARARGLSDRRVLWRHGLRGAAIPVLTTVLNHIPHVIGGSMIVERIFGWPGLGDLLFFSVNNRDYMVIMGVTVLVALAVLLAHLLMDILYHFADPRLRWEGGRQ